MARTMVPIANAVRDWRQLYAGPAVRVTDSTASRNVVVTYFECGRRNLICALYVVE